MTDIELVVLICVGYLIGIVAGSFYTSYLTAKKAKRNFIINESQKP